MNAMKLTVGIPTFNRAALLRETIESVLAQSFTSFRLIVSDNASDDDTPEVVRSFDDERIEYVRSAHNVGSIGNLNRLIGLAETEFLVLLPDDDILYPGHLGAAVEVLQRFETVGLVHSAFNMIDERSRVIRRVDPVASQSPVMIERREPALERLMSSPWGLCFPSVVYRTEALVQAGGLREQEGPFGDRQLWMRMALEWDFGYLAEPLAGLRIHPNRVTTGVGAERARSSDEDERVHLYAQVIFERRVDFLDEAPLEFQTKESLRALATLHLLIESAALGRPWREVAARLANLVWTYPRILLRRALWRLVVAQLGGRRARSALPRAWARGGRLHQG
jgi:glycosyltransferase involved in cell wall biosynthesis